MMRITSASRIGASANAETRCFVQRANNPSCSSGLIRVLTIVLGNKSPYKRTRYATWRVILPVATI
jgi:hypothetical protein